MVVVSVSICFAACGGSGGGGDTEPVAHDLSGPAEIVSEGGVEYDSQDRTVVSYTKKAATGDELWVAFRSPEGGESSPQRVDRKDGIETSPEAESVRLIVTRKLSDSDIDRVHVFWYQQVPHEGTTVRALLYRRYVIDASGTMAQDEAYPSPKAISLDPIQVPILKTTLKGHDSIGFRHTVEFVDGGLSNTNSLMFVRHQEFTFNGATHRLPVVGLFGLNPNDANFGKFAQQAIAPSWVEWATKPYISSPLASESLGDDTDTLLQNYNAFVVWTATSDGVSFVTSATRTIDTPWNIVDDGKDFGATDARLVKSEDPNAKAPYLVWKDKSSGAFDSQTVKARRLGGSDITPVELTAPKSKIREVSATELASGELLVGYKHEESDGKVGASLSMANLKEGGQGSLSIQDLPFQSAVSQEFVGRIHVKRAEDQTAIVTWSRKNGTSPETAFRTFDGAAKQLSPEAVLPNATPQRVIHRDGGSPILLLTGKPDADAGAELLASTLSSGGLWSPPAKISTSPVQVDGEKAKLAAKPAIGGKVKIAYTATKRVEVKTLQ